MQEHLRKRRRETWEMLIVKGYDYRRVCDTLADRYDVVPKTIEKDIQRMDDWLPRLIHYDDDDGTSRLLELQANRQRLHQMATEARQDNERMDELKVRRHIDQNISTEVELAQSLGAMNREAEKREHEHDFHESFLAGLNASAINESE